jgi:hypothetical protein
MCFRGGDIIKFLKAIFIEEIPLEGILESEQEFGIYKTLTSE